MVCSTCGSQLFSGASFCHQCGATLKRSAAPVRYAGFWRRVAAVFIDLLLMAPVYITLKEAFLTPSAKDGQLMASALFSQLSPADEQLVKLIVVTWAGNIAGFIFLSCGVYYVLAECSPLQGTLGKRLLGLRVADLDGNQLRFGKALKRYLYRVVSSIPFYVGFVMAGFTKRKQALHDILASTLVVMADKETMGPAASNERFEYASFWRRTFAVIVDTLLIFILFAYTGRHLLPPASPGEPFKTAEDYYSDRISYEERDQLHRKILAEAKTGYVVLTAMFGLYYVIAEISPLDGTLGKRLLGIRVADLNGRRLTLGRAVGRFLGRWLSAGIWQIGFLMAAFTSRKQGLHDILAGALVLRRPRRGEPPQS